METESGTQWSFGRFTIRSRSAIDHIPPVDWIIDGLLPCDSYAVLFAPPGSYKTFLALDMAMAVAHGFPGPECQHAEAINLPGPVLYIVGEGLPAFRSRIAGWEARHSPGHRAGDLYVMAPVPRLSDNPEGLARAIKDTGVAKRTA